MWIKQNPQTDEICLDSCYHEFRSSLIFLKSFIVSTDVFDEKKKEIFYNMIIMKEWLKHTYNARQHQLYCCTVTVVHAERCILFQESRN